LTLFRQLYDRSKRAFTYLVADIEARAAIVVDPEHSTVLPVLALVDEQGLQLARVLCTHAHTGTPTAAVTVRERSGAQVVAGIRAPLPADIRVRNGDTVTFGSETVRVLDTPGHTAGDVSYLWRDRLFSGDALLIRGCGSTDLAGGDAGMLFDSITQRLLVLPGDTLVFPCHETHHRSVSTIAEERAYNPCVAGRSRDEFITQRYAR
jgi:glyoxylase-like metal-dependent hydrolase (beta-lactamase superfamily II)